MANSLQCWLGLAHDLAIPATSNLFAAVSETPAVQTLARRMENGGVLSCTGVSLTAQPFFAALLHHIFPQQPIVVVTEGLKTQESFQEDIGTWLALESKIQGPKSKVSEAQTSTVKSEPLYYPPWEILPHESRLPHA